MKNKILKEIEIRKEIYKKSPSDMIAAYNGEIATEKEYNGRQLLELLQNADDEKSDEVEINLDTKNKILTISNRGDKCTPFSYEGIRALMISNLSPKTNQKFIGNKGLGFRSIINWSDKVTISSNGLDIVFSREIVENTFDELFNKEEQENIKNESKHKDTKSIPFLSIPTITEVTKSTWTTSIVLKYKDDYLKDIKKQINEIKEEILLFLNHIKRLAIIVDDEVQLNIEKEALSSKWTIFPKRDKLPNNLWDNEDKEEFFDLKIALQDNLENDTKELFAYFPTKIDINFPFIIHGTFELNSSRNELVDSLKNRYILKQLVELIVETARNITKEEVSYKALEMLTYNHESKHKILEELEFYKEIDNAIEELKIFPCLDGQYRKNDEVIYSNELSKFVKEIINESLFPDLLIPINKKVSLESYPLDTSIDSEKFNELSRNIQDIDERVELIYLIRRCFNNDKLELLVDEDKNITTIDTELYSPKFSNMENLNIPNYLKDKIKFLNKELGNKLLEKFEIKDKKSYRVLIDHLSNITNLKEYETAIILTRIISESRKINTISTTKEMIISLYENYKINKISIKTQNIPCLNQKNEIVFSKDLYLSKTYPSGKLTELLFKSITPEEAFLSDISIYDFKVDDDRESIELFFTEFLGVNKYTKFSEIINDDNYINFIFTKVPKPSGFKEPKFNLLKIDNFENIKNNLSLENFILWLFKDEKIAEELSKLKTIEYFYRTHHQVPNVASYILYQIISSEIFKDYLITNEKLSKLANKTSIDFDYTLFKEYDIGEHSIKALLLKVGAAEKMEDLSIDKIKDILIDLPTTSPDGKLTGTIYKAVRNHNQVLDDSSIKLCAKKDGVLDYYDRHKVFYVNRRKLPKKILDDTAIVNIPPRLGNVMEFFGIKDVKSIAPKIKAKNVNEELTGEFKQFFEKIKLYILVYRFEKLRSTDKKIEVAKLKNVEIFLCHSISYEKDSNNYELLNNDYLSDNKKYYIKIENKSLKDIRKTLDFRETFADIIGSIFNIAGIEEFTRIVSDEIAETEEIIKRNIGYEALQEAREFLNIADDFSSFWRVLYQLKSMPYKDKYIENELATIIEELNIASDLSSMDYINLKSYEVITKLFTELSISIKEFNDKAYYKLNFKEYHSSNLENQFHTTFDSFKKLLYQWCQDESKEEEFIDLIGKYENADKIIRDNILEINYIEIVGNFIEDNFNFKNSHSDIKFENIYEENMSKIDMTKLTENKHKSLLYFGDKLDEIKKIISDIESKNKSSITPLNKNIGIPNDVNKDAKFDSPPDKSPSNNQKSSGGSYGNQNPNSDKQKKEKGDKAEECAYNWLVKEYGEENVKWIAKESDSKHYDLRYTADNTNWKYVEVKTYSNGFFHLSTPEKDFATNERDNYEIFFVEFSATNKCMKIHIVKDIDFTNEIQFRLEADTYKVYYKLKDSTCTEKSPTV